MHPADLYDEANVRDVKEMKKKKSLGAREPMANISNPSIPIERPKVSHLFNSWYLFIFNVCITLQFRFLEGEGKGRGGGGGRGRQEEVVLITRLQDRELQEMRDEGESCDYRGNNGGVM